MNQTTPFVVSEFRNPSGKIVFRVSGQLDEKRVRKNFPTRAEAVAERQFPKIARARVTATAFPISAWPNDTTASGTPAA